MSTFANLVPGANAPVPTGLLSVEVAITPAQVQGAEVDISAFLLTTSGKVRGDQDMVFYGQKASGTGCVALTDTQSGKAWFTADLARLEAGIEKVAFTATIHENRQQFGVFSELKISVKGSDGQPCVVATLPSAGMTESALILGELYLRQGQWKFRAIGQGFSGGLKPLAEHFGISITDVPVASPTPVVPPVSAQPSRPISLTKITLDKSKSSVSLEKKAGGFGEIRVNLNWNRGTQNKGLLGGMFGSKGIDLDLGCLFEMRDGTVSGIQALGNRFGHFHDLPFIELQGDDRTGAVSEGEWMRINGKHWDEFKRIIIFAFIYDGAPNWASTDGVVTIFVPNEPPIEVKLTEGSNRLGMCAIALLENDRGAIKVNREVSYFQGHEDMDRAYHWGLRYSAGSKD